MAKLSHRPEESIVGSKAGHIFPMLKDKLALVLNDGKERRIKKFNSTCLMGTHLSAHILLKPIKDKKDRISKVSVVFNGISGGCPLGKKLSDSEKMIAIGKIASSLAHGVRNPLNAIKGAVVYLSEKYGHESTLLEFSTIINEEIDKLDTFISNFLSAAKGEMRFAAVNINGVLKSILVMIKPRAEIQNVVISSSFSDLPAIIVDSFQIEQALFNIINNALEAMPTGGTIDIKTSLQWEKNNDYVVVEITDTGKGIPDSEMQSLGELSDSAEGKDRGFGIFLSREVIKSHKGKLLWESVRNRGTTFKVFLPVTRDGQ